ncbi:MAG: hypothetical protein KJ646_03885 [Nanoarchaeota archaeon]|nr:hypothetical protein [Nanoarchaeota archaeon]MBU4116140.1 hypothetical protein [Nanoarchaeota archaeon]
MNKKASHVGIILSFAIFITFLAFLYSITEPAFQTQKNQKILLSYLQKELIDQSSLNINSSSVKIIVEETNNCIRLKDLLDDIGMGLKVIVKNTSEFISESYKVNNDLVINRVSAQEDFFKIYSSEEFKELDNNIINPCANLKRNDNDYSIGLTKKEVYIFDTELINLINKYENDYLAFKNELKIPEGNDFAFSFKLSNGTIISTSEKDVTTSIYAEEVPIQYMDKNAKINYGFLTVKIW